MVPQTRRDNVVETLHGVEVADPYRWLERGDDPEVRAWTTAQDEVARGELAGLPAFATAAAQLRSVYYRDEVGAPVVRGDRRFYLHRVADREKQFVAWRQGAAGVEHVLLDPNTWTTDARTLGEWWPSRDGKLVAYVTRDHNADEEVVRVRDVDAGTDRADVIGGLKWTTPSWTPDSTGFYYRWLPPKGAGPETERRGKAELRFHALGTDPATDPVMYPATGDAGIHLDGFVSHDGRWLFATLDRGFTATDVYVRDLHDKHATWRTVVRGVDAVFKVTVFGDRFFLYTDDGAPRYRVMVATPAKLARSAWTELVPEREDATLQRVQIVGGKLVLTYLHDAATQLEIHDLDGARVRRVDLPPFGSADGITGDPDDDTGYISYRSFTEPGIVWRISLATGALTEQSRLKLPIDTSAYVTEQVWYPAKDGTKVSMFVVHKRDVKPTGRVPTLLFGYGGFGLSITPDFAFGRTTWLEAGGVYAIANLRGGGEYGEPWHRAALADKKQVSIDDYLAAAHYLIDSGWTSPATLAFYGGSNGGMVVTAAMTQEPALARAVVAISPLTDMVRYAKFGHASAWIPEYGSADDPSQFKALRAYSPYHAVVAGTRYPALLVMVGETDDRVDPMHGRKLVAAVQAATASGEPVWLYVIKATGHNALDSAEQQIQIGAAIQAFLWSRVGGS